jgi:hypothetical protein
MKREDKQKLTPDNEGIQSEATMEKSRLPWLFQAALSSFMIWVVVLVLMCEKPVFGEADRGGDVTSIISDSGFRSTSRESLSGDSVIEMLEDNGFYDLDWNNSASGFANDYKLQNDGKVVFDRASGLMWQQSGSAKDISFDEARKYVSGLNSDQFAGYSNWRLPTLEEAMSLVEPIGKSGGLNIDQVFDNTQRWIWTSDVNSMSLAWLVNFVSSNCYTYVNDYFDFTSGGYVRAVR